jgi:hypothetical protein
VYHANLNNFYPQFSSNQKFNEASLSINNSKSQELFKLFQNFDKMNIKEIDPTTLLNEREKLLFEKGFNIIVDEINDLIFKLLNKEIQIDSVKGHVIEYFNDHSVNSQEIHNWLLDNQNSPNSVFLLGYFNFFEIETNKGLTKAFNLFFNASEKNHILAQSFVGDCYLDGCGTMKNEKLGFEYYEKIANRNFAHGQLNIGYYCYTNGIGVEKDFKKAFYWCEKAANNGNIIAMFNLGDCYLDGKGIEKDHDKAFEWIKQSAEGGFHSVGISMLGYCYRNGIGTKIDNQKAFELYRKASNLGDVVAQYNLGGMYEYELSYIL